MSFGDEDSLVGIPGDFEAGNPVSGVSSLSDRWNLTMLGWPNLEGKHSYGLGVRIAIIDSGYSPEPGLPVPELIKAFGYKYPVDNNGHGTHVFGIVASIAPTATYHIYKVLGGDRLGAFSNIVKAVRMAIDQNMDIINLSLGGYRVDPDLKAAIEDAVDKGIIVVCASGNTGQGEILFPASMEDVIAVGAVNRFKAIASFSTFGKEIDVVAPGVDIVSNYPAGEMRACSGTSMAAPHVTGVIALIIDHYKAEHDERPNLKKIMHVLYSNCIDLGVMGWDEKCGNGLIQVTFHKRAKDLLVNPPWYMRLVYKGLGIILKIALQQHLKKQNASSTDSN